MKLIFDSHAHYDDRKFNDDRDVIIKSMLKSNIAGIINCAVDIKNSKTCINLCKKYPNMFCALGVHPHEADGITSNFIPELEDLLSYKKAVAIGEIGLDYHYDFSPRDKQLYVFESQLELSKKLNIPVIVHDRESHADTLQLLKEYKPTGVVHCFSGSEEMAKEITDLGMYIGIGGAVTFKNAKKIIDVVKSTPIEKILVETDAPYMTPVPFRGTRCTSDHIDLTAQKIAEIKGMSKESVLINTKDNACKLFGISLD